MQEQGVKLSFVIPAYNEEVFIGRCLESVLRETAKCPLPTEIIVVNNNSTDRTAEIAASYEGVRVVLETKQGLVQSRQRGFEEAKGELVANIDSDVIVPEGWLGTVIDRFQKNDIVALSGPYIYYDLPAWKRGVVRLYYGIAYLLYMAHGALLQGGNFVLKRSALAEIGGYRLNLAFWGEDTDVAIRIHKVGRIMFTFSLPMLTSARRLKAEGIFRTGYNYVMNYAWIVFFHRPFTSQTQANHR
jgi:glycosyltransferase involved in cell wall biosynthesis